MNEDKSFVFLFEISNIVAYQNEVVFYLFD